MIKGNIFKRADEALEHREKFTADNRSQVLAINEKNAWVEMRNGDKIYWVVIKFAQDQWKAGGFLFNEVEFFGVDPEVREYVRTRVRPL